MKQPKFSNPPKIIKTPQHEIDAMNKRLREHHKTIKPIKTTAKMENGRLVIRAAKKKK